MIKLDLKPAQHILAQFAWLAAFAFPLVAAVFTRGDARVYEVWAWNWTGPVVLWLAALGALQLVLFLAGVHHLTHALYVVLMLVAVPIGFVISHVLIAFVFYVVMTPIGLVFRLTGRDAMSRRRDRGIASYWHDRGAPRPASSYFKLY
jgi:hypothetical protein